MPGILETPGIDPIDPILPPPLVTALVNPPGMRAPSASRVGQKVSVRAGKAYNGSV